MQIGDRVEVIGPTAEPHFNRKRGTVIDIERDYGFRPIVVRMDDPTLKEIGSDPVFSFEMSELIIINDKA